MERFNKRNTFKDIHLSHITRALPIATLTISQALEKSRKQLRQFTRGARYQIYIETNSSNNHEEIALRQRIVATERDLLKRNPTYTTFSSYIKLRPQIEAKAHRLWGEKKRNKKKSYGKPQR